MVILIVVSITAHHINNFISHETSETIIDNGSDDDVIEVVRDEAPIEILSDGEEMEIEKSNQANLNSFSESFSFANPNALETTVEEKFPEVEDPLKNLCEIQNTYTITEQQSATTISDDARSLEITNKIDEKSNHDSSGENCYINVTDVGNSTENDAEKLKQTVQEELSNEIEANTIDSNVPVDNETAISNIIKQD